ncbi:DUF5908 family protein [Shewanella frigidimarina]|uniref:DUF5908 family protein n=1 Tax=Shewanella frigidimarina TaxID=56812 RepID=UPI003D79E01A
MSIEIKQLVIKSSVVEGGESASLPLMTEAELDEHKEQMLKSCLQLIQQKRTETRER